MKNVKPDAAIGAADGRAVTRKTRAEILRILTRGREGWDRDTVRVHRDGTVTARTDPDKTFRGGAGPRTLVGTVGGILGMEAEERRMQAEVDARRDAGARVHLAAIEAEEA